MAGVQGALSREEPDASGSMRRYAYVQLTRGVDFESVRQQIDGDRVYLDEPTFVLPVTDLNALECEDRGVVIERLAAGAGGPHASLLLESRADELALLCTDDVRRCPRIGRPAALRLALFPVCADSVLMPESQN